MEKGPSPEMRCDTALQTDIRCSFQAAQSSDVTYLATRELRFPARPSELTSGREQS